MMKRILIVLCMAAHALAAPPATRPRGPERPPEAAPLVGQAIDPRQPAFVPKFAQVNNPPSGQYEERRYANQFTVPGPYYFGCGGYGYGGYGLGAYGWGGFGGGSWGSTSVAFR